MKNRLVMISVLLAVIIVGCSNNQFTVNSDKPPSQDLRLYLPADEYEFMGEGDYYHYYQVLKTSEFDDRIVVEISGEVKDNSMNSGKDDYGFNLDIWIDSEKMVQVHSGEMLNETEFNRMILLKTPLVQYQTWTFDASDKSGKNHEVTGSIIEIDDANKTIIVEYTTESGYYERRTFTKKYGTTSFVKKVSYKNAVTFTGYHLNRTKSSNRDDSEMDLKYNQIKVIDIDYEMYQLIDGFNLRWVRYIQNIDQSLLELIDEESDAYSKIVGMREESIELKEYLGFKPYMMKFDEDKMLIFVMEKFLVSGDKNHYNYICYELVQKDDGLLITDFYSVNP